MRRLAVRCLSLLAPLTASCASPVDEPGAAFLGQYYATEEVTIVGSADPMPTLTLRDRTPVTILQGSIANVVINDGQCLIPADVIAANRLMVRPNTGCERRVEGGMRVVLTILSGGAELTGRNLVLTARGSFEIVGSDGGVVGIQRGTFMLTASGARE